LDIRSIRFSLIFILPKCRANSGNWLDGCDPDSWYIQDYGSIEEYAVYGCSHFLKTPL